MEPVQVLLEEYKTLRQEILTAMSNRNSILSFGQASIGAVFTASIISYKTTSYSLLSSLSLIFVVPTVVSFVLFMWIGEYQRMQRAGKFLVELEERINGECKQMLLSWETSLRSKRLHMKYPYNTTVMLLTLISVVSVIVGLFSLQLSSRKSIFILIGVFVLHYLLFKYSVMKISKMRL
jgi:hypothetical protein